jgi:hypothetical protein
MTQTGTIFHPWQAWWFLGDDGTVVLDGRGEVIEGGRAAPAWLTGITHPLIVVIAIPLTFALWRVRRGRVSPADALALLVLLLHLRCLLDVWNNVYYSIPAVLALLAWETLHRRRPPALTLLATVLVWVSFEELRGLPRDAIAAIYLAWAVPAALLLAGHLWHRRPIVSQRSTPLDSGTGLVQPSSPLDGRSQVVHMAADHWAAKQSSWPERHGAGPGHWYSTYL